ncbi:DNA cytosine methyltransferase [Bordetella hinzii]|uniref:DNA cytosine methyltransferase n=1 Tax=Bordetella hinzii TaxID=103855 RepID=UPI001C01A328|nr:DNA cytosine methyltransferase [Bordetella hinzii]QWF39286.1 DNA cytosine methyltransferase [Bordetella hinzii]QWF43833.1 DNA cytosine methyltransferase [Bordetella hinzii]QWF48369.1 DNA cytosine methyltransferase [Bordetella hinzii]QWF52906.1 DNA cytosine methyltransferase [Bordetella hinzii]QWF57395.1 DNA cytosine methyltransferase [Bordetella hinzii]
MIHSEISHFHLFSGAGVGAAGMQDARPEIPGLAGRMVCLGGIDVDAAGAADFHRFTGVRCTVRDLFSRQQYTAFHGREPADGWVEAMPQDIRAAAGGRRPNIMFLSAPCKGFSGLLSQSRSLTDKYQALNALTLRGVWLALEAWKDDPVEVILFENVPRIASRGRHFLDQIVQLLRHYGYVVRETAHDCGELGGLAQSRKRFLLIARHAEKVPAFIYEPPKRPLRAVCEILGRMHLPGDLRAGPMHRIPNLSWKTWVRLAFVEAGSDWRSLNRLAVQDGYLRDFLLVPEMHAGVLGVRNWSDASGTVTGNARPVTGSFSVADPRFDPSAAWKDGQAYGVRRWDASTGAIAGQQGPGQGTYSVADPRHHGPAKHSNEFRIVRYDDAARAVTGAHGTGQCVADPRTGWPESAHGSKLAVTAYEAHAKTVTGARFGSGGLCVADPRGAEGYSKYAVTAWDGASRTVISGSTTGQGAFAVADPRPGLARERGDHYLTAGHYGVAAWDRPIGAVSASACHDNGAWSVADPRQLPAANDKLVCRIIAEDGTWHRPFTTLELAALQSLYDPDDYAEAEQQGAPFQMEGSSDSAHRERIGNAVPRKAAKAMAEEIGRAILLARAGESFQLSSTPIWVRPIVTALAVRGGEGA